MKARMGKHEVEIDDKRVRGATNTRCEKVELSSGKAKPTTEKKATPAPTKYDSKWEERYAKVLEMEQKAGNIVKWWYHPWHMRLPGGARYELDFLVQHHGHIEAVDVKGWHKNMREAMLRIKVAASIYTCYTWSIAKWNGRDFDMTPVEVNPW